MGLFHSFKTVVLFILVVTLKNTVVLRDDHTIFADILYYLVLIWALHKYAMSYKLPKLPETEFSVCIIGDGFSGIGMGIKLKQMGVKFRIIEKASHLGGTWWENQYPGCACDVASHLYRSVCLFDTTAIQKEHSLLTGLQIVFPWLSMNFFLKFSQNFLS